jgi:hypothetical protein
MTSKNTVMITVKHFRDLEVYQGAMEMMSATALTKEFPAARNASRSDAGGPRTPSG